MSTSPRDVPVTVIGGFLGAGKTTLVNHIIRSMTDVRVGVLVNDFGELEIDKQMIVAAEDDVVSLANGCICCSMRGGVMSTVYRLLERDDAPEHLVVEASGVSDPRTLAELFIEAERIGVVRLDALVGVVDLERFDPTDSLTRAQLLATDIVVVNKIDLVDASRRLEVEEEVRSIAPHARIVSVEHADVPVPILLGAGAHAAREMGPVHGIDASAFRSWTYRRPEPFSYRALFPVLTDLPPTIYRVKGLLDLEERAGQEVLIQIVGRRVWVKTIGERTGESGTALAFIGAKAVDPTQINATLDAL